MVITAQRNRGNNPFGAVCAHPPTDQGAPESNRKTKNLHPAPAGHQVVPKLMHKNEQGQGEQKSQYGLQKAHDIHSVSAR
jgi:hypothetical protein